MKGGPEGGPRPASQCPGQGDGHSARTSSPDLPTTPLFDEGCRGPNSCSMTCPEQALGIYCVLGSSKKNPQISLTGPCVSLPVPMRPHVSPPAPPCPCPRMSPSAPVCPRLLLCVPARPVCPRASPCVPARPCVSPHIPAHPHASPGKCSSLE